MASARPSEKRSPHVHAGATEMHPHRAHLPQGLLQDIPGSKQPAVEVAVDGASARAGEGGGALGVADDVDFK